jgi:perosamine synthetase
LPPLSPVRDRLGLFRSRRRFRGPVSEVKPRNGQKKRIILVHRVAKTLGAEAWVSKKKDRVSSVLAASYGGKREKMQNDEENKRFMLCANRAKLPISPKQSLPQFLNDILRRVSSHGLAILRKVKILMEGLRGFGRPRHSFFSGTTAWREIWLALRALAGRMPLVEGPDIAEYENRFAAITGSRYAFSFASGRMGLHVILEALGIGPGDEIVLPAFTCVVVPKAMIYCGARPVYVDVEPVTYNIDVRKIEKKITPRTKAIYAQHTFGIVCDMEDISRIAEKYGLYVIEDCAHALGASLNGRMAGSLGHVAYFSTDHSKVISTSTGGMITTSDPDIAPKICEAQRSTPFLTATSVRAVLWTFIIDYVLYHPRLVSIGSLIHAKLAKHGRLFYFYDELPTVKPSRCPYPARLSNAQAKIGISQLERLHENVAFRRALALSYDNEIKAYGKAFKGDFSSSTFVLYTFLVRDRQAWKEYLSPVMNASVLFAGICGGRETNLHEVGYKEGDCPIAEEVAKHCVNLPTHPRVRYPYGLLALLKDAAKDGNEGLEFLDLGAIAADQAGKRQVEYGHGRSHTDIHQIEAL